MVSRWNRSQATMPCACPRRNSAHEGAALRGEGSMPALCRIVQDGGAADPVAEDGELAIDPSITHVGFSVGRRGWRVDRAGRAGWSSAERRATGASTGSWLV